MNRFFNIQQYKKEINTLNLKIIELEDIIKNELYKYLIDNCSIVSERDRLKKENKKLREKVKVLKNLINEKD